jgi:hypothetical protein
LNLTLTSLFNLLDCYGYTLREFFEDMEWLKKKFASVEVKTLTTHNIRVKFAATA